MRGDGCAQRTDAMTKLPNAQSAEVARTKIVDYLLSTWHPEGMEKARFFLRFGFSRDKWTDFAEALKNHALTGKVTNTVVAAYGIRYQIDGTLKTPDGRNPEMTTVWQIDSGNSIPRLITAYPLRR